MEDRFFVGIADSAQVRKELLTSSKDILDALKRYEVLKRIRSEKVVKIADVKRVFEELLLLNKKLRGKLPTIAIKESLETPQVSQNARDLPKNKVDVLEKELSRIESRLSSLE